MRKSEKKFRGMMPSVVCLITTLLLTGCSLFGGSNTIQNVGKAPANQQIYTTPLILSAGSTDLTTLDPALAYDQNSLSVISMLYTGLVELDDHLQVQPQLARSWNLSADGLTWTFHLYAGLKFSDGTPLTASDVAYSIDRALQPTTKSTVAWNYLHGILNANQLRAGIISTVIGDSNGLQVVDPLTLKIVTQKKMPYFLSMLANACSYVVEQKLINNFGAAFTDHLNAGGGDGPFMVSQYIHGQKLVLVPNPDYYGSHPQLRQVIMPMYTQEETAYNDYAAGKVDSAGVPLAALPAISQRPDYHQVPLLWINYYTMNYKVAPFDNIDIRQAFALAINKTAIAQNVWKNTVIPTNHIVPQGMPGYNASLAGPDGTQGLTGNPAKAQALLTQGMQAEGWSSKAQIPAITLTYASGSSNFDQEVQSMVQMWKQVLGITVKLNSVDPTSLLEQIAAATGNAQGLQMWGLSWLAEYPDPQNWLTNQFDNGSIYNNMNYGANSSGDVTQQQATQQLMETADSTTQSAARIQMYQQVEQKLVNDIAWLPIEQVSSVFLRKLYVTGIVDNSTGYIPPNDWAKIYILQH